MDGEETLLQRRKKNVRISKEETLLILRAYREHPTRWADVLDDIRQNIDHLPDAARDLYTNGPTKKLTDRMSSKLAKLVAIRGDIQDVDIRREVQQIRDNERRHVPDVPAREQADDQSGHVQEPEPDPQPGPAARPEQAVAAPRHELDNNQPRVADRRDAMAAALSDTESDAEPAASEPRRRRRRLADLIRENHELDNVFMKIKVPRLMRQFGLDSSSDE